MLIIFATIMSISDPTGDLSPSGALVWLAVWRIILGIGVGGDYPMSASIATDRAHLRRRGTLLAYIFANQGWGSFVGALVVMIVLLCYKHTMDVEGHTSKVDGVWRICIGLSLVPAFGTLYQRLTLPESKKFEASRKINSQEGGDGEDVGLKKEQAEKQGETLTTTTSVSASEEASASKKQIALAKKAHFRGMPSVVCIMYR
jgi:MFS transporter, PHS family, inorganic phosphate transporter